MTEASQIQKERLENVTGALTSLTEKLEKALQSVRATLEAGLEKMRGDNAEKLEQIRVTVDEKLQGTLEQRLGASFKLVSEQLEQVFRSVGEMQTLATGVGDLKKMLSNVKMRGAWGEVALGNLLEQVLTIDQFERNVEVRPAAQSQARCRATRR
jgi:DNA recombination protein RmuC